MGGIPGLIHWTTPAPQAHDRMQDGKALDGLARAGVGASLWSCTSGEDGWAWPYPPRGPVASVTAVGEEGGPGSSAYRQCVHPR